MRTYDRLRTLEERLFSQWHLTAQQYNALRLLQASGSQAVPTLSLVSRMVSKSPDITRMLDRLEANGLIARERSEADRRTVLVKITDQGLALLDQIVVPLARVPSRTVGASVGRRVENVETACWRKLACRMKPLKVYGNLEEVARLKTKK